MGSIFMNVSANMLGLDNAATPLGLKAMQELQDLNTKKDTATDAMIMFLVVQCVRSLFYPYKHNDVPGAGGGVQPH